MERYLFYREVYDIVKEIPEGRLVTYGQIAYLMGKPLCSRMVGQALFHVPVDYTSSRRNFCIRSFFSRRLACACFWHGNIGVLDWLDCIDEMARLPFPMVIWRHGFYVSILCRGIVATAKMATGGL